MIVINPQYESLRQQISAIPAAFATSGKVLYQARNELREIDGLVVKRYHRPLLVNRIAYLFRPSKAKRAYENGLYMLAHGIATPTPVAYIEEYTCGLLHYSYLITEKARYTRLNREWTIDYTPELEETIRPLARYTAQMHNAGILHLDFSPGNILFDKVDGEYRFEVVDINRMRVGKAVSLKEGCKSLRRLCAKTSFFVTFADEYAKARNMNADECRKWILYYRDKFWQNGKKAAYEYV